MGYLIIPMQKSCIDDVLRIAENEGLSPWSYTDYEAEIERTDSITLQAVHHDTNNVIGFIVTRLITIKDGILPSSFNLLNIGVDQFYKKRGIATKLITTTLQQISAHAPAEIWLEVRKENLPAITLYKKHGFTQQGIRKNFYRLPDEDAIVMKLALDQKDT